jgi:hypothetical protein
MSTSNRLLSLCDSCKRHILQFLVGEESLHYLLALNNTLNIRGYLFRMEIINSKSQQQLRNLEGFDSLILKYGSINFEYILNMISLRYLDMNITSPVNLSRLCNLNTLILVSSLDNSFLQNTLPYLSNLRHLTLKQVDQSKRYTLYTPLSFLCSLALEGYCLIENVLRDVNNLTTLNLTDSTVDSKTLDYISYMSNLINLSLHLTLHVSSLPISLNYLYLYLDSDISMDFLSTLTNLVHLKLVHYIPHNIDIIATLALQSLDYKGCNIINKGMPSLIHLKIYITSFQIRNFDFSLFPSLTHLSVTFNNLLDINCNFNTSISSLFNLTSLCINGNFYQPINILFLSSLPQLTSLCLSSCLIENKATLSNMDPIVNNLTNLTQLSITNCGTAKVDQICKLSKLNRLHEFKVYLPSQKDRDIVKCKLQIPYLNLNKH